VPIFNIGSFNPVVQRRFGNPEILGDLLLGRFSFPGYRDNITTKLGWFCFWHVDSFLPETMSLKVMCQPKPGQTLEQLLDLVHQLSNRVQVLLAIASGIPEAYVIFETLNDRGADLTTADLLKNFLFSQATPESLGYIESAWTEISGAFDKPDDLVKFIRFEHASNFGRVTNRQLYRALQESIGLGSSNVKKYLKRLKAALGVFSALRDPDHKRWGGISTDVRDALLAYRRFGFESSMPLLLALFREWGDPKAAKLVNVVAGWSVRAMIAGRLGGGSAEEAFCGAAKAVADGEVLNQPQLRSVLAIFVPSDREFIQFFITYGPVSTTRAKYLLAMIEREYCRANRFQSPPDWSSKTVTIEHIIPASSKKASFQNTEEFERFQGLRDQLWNFTLLEGSLNREAEDKPFGKKKQVYGRSSFRMTKELGARSSWMLADAEEYAATLAKARCENLEEVMRSDALVWIFVELLRRSWVTLPVW
jgi:Protein of unknown function (DUF1524)